MNQNFYTTTDGTLLRLRQKTENASKPTWYDAYVAFYGDVLILCEVVATQPHVHNVSVGERKFYDTRYLYHDTSQ